MCSVSMSEGEGDGELEGLAGRVTELRELLQGKEAVVEALHAEIDDLRVDVSSPTSSHSQNSNRDTIPMYIAKVCTIFILSSTTLVVNYIILITSLSEMIKLC